MSNYKKVLLGHEEIFNYLNNLNDGGMDGDFLWEFVSENFRECSAHLVIISTNDILTENSENHLIKKRIQNRLNNSDLSQVYPILVDQNNVIIDGHHRYRAHLYQKKKEILCYKIIDD